MPATFNSTATTRTLNLTTTHFSEWTSSSINVPLPISLLSFSGSRGLDEVVELVWVTTSERGNQGFLVEKSMNGVNFHELGWVVGGGNSQKKLQYTFRDEKTSTAAYYRLQQVDWDGKYAYSHIVYLAPSLKTFLTLYPNPVDNEVTLIGDHD